MRRRPTFTRADRLGTLMRDEVERVVDFELTSSVARQVQVTDAVLAPDLGHLRVRYVLRQGDDPSDKAQEALDRVAGYVARSLSESLQLHRAPRVVFSFDKEFVRLRKVRELLEAGAGQSGAGASAPGSEAVAAADSGLATDSSAPPADSVSLEPDEAAQRGDGAA